VSAKNSYGASRQFLWYQQAILKVLADSSYSVGTQLLLSCQ
jgi:hypothetical protein